MLTRIKIALRGQAALVGTLKNMSRKAQDTSQLMARLAILGYKDVINHFAKEEGPDGKWKSLKAATVKRRRLGGGDHRILQDTGRLRASIQPTVESPRRAVIATTNVIYAATHHYGDSRRNIPARPYMWLSRHSIDAMIKEAQAYFKTHGHIYYIVLIVLTGYSAYRIYRKWGL